jgi:hypothetical protein
MDDTVPTRHWLRALALAALALILAGPAGCSSYVGTTVQSFLPQYIGTTAQSFLLRIRNDPDPNIRYLAYSKLASPHCYDNDAQVTEAVGILVSKLDGSQEPTATRAVICRTLGELGHRSAREALLKAVNDPEGIVRVQACRALGKVGQPEDATILARIMTVDTLEDCRIAAIESLGELKSKDGRILQMLLAGMEHDDPAIRLASVKSLRRITGLDRGVEVAAWRDVILPKTDPAAPAAGPAPPSNPAPAPAAAPAPAPIRR